MPGDTAQTSADYEALFDEQKRDAMVIAQSAPDGSAARPITDLDWNMAEKIRLHMARRLAQAGFGNGATHEDCFRISATGANNDFTINRPSGTDAARLNTPFLVGGLPVVPFYTGSFVSNIDPDNGIHRQATAVSGAKIVDEDVRYGVNSLVGRTVWVSDGAANTDSYTVTSNSEYEITTSGNPAADGHVAGDAYWLAPGTPSGADREDTIWLDTWLDEIDATEDGDLNQNVGGTTMETTRRKRIRSALFYSHGSSGDFAPVSLGDSAYGYTDLNGHEHVCFELSTGYRKNGIDAIKHDDLDDRRLRVGKTSQDSWKEAALSLWQGCVAGYDSFTPSRNSGNHQQLDLDGGLLYNSIGELVVLDSRSFTAQTGGAAWSVGVKHYCYATARNRIVVNLVAPDTTIGDVPLCEFTPSGAAEIGTVTDTRVAAYRLGQNLGTDNEGRMNGQLAVRGKVPFRFYDDAASPTLKGRIGFDEASGVGANNLYLLSEEGVPAKFGQRVAGGLVRGHVVDNTTDLTADPDVAAAGTIITLGPGVVDESTALSPSVRYSKKLKVKDKFQAPHIIYGTVTGTNSGEDPVDLDIVVPAWTGVWTDATLLADVAVASRGCATDQYPYFHLDSTKTAPAASAIIPIFRLLAPVPRGAVLPASCITLKFYNQLAGVATLRLVAKLEGQVSAAIGGTTDPVIFGSTAKTFAVAGAGEETIVITPNFGATPTLNNQHTLWVSLYLEAGGDWNKVAAGGLVRFKQMNITGTLRGQGQSVVTSVADSIGACVLGSS